MSENNTRFNNVNITTLSIIKVLVIILIVWFLYLIKEVLAILFVALVLSSAFDPWVDFLERKKIPRVLGILMIYVVLFAILSLVFVILIPPLIEETKQLIESFPVYYEKVSQVFSRVQAFTTEKGFMQDGQKAVESLESGFAKAAGGVFSTVAGFFGGIVSFFLVLVITFYLTVQEGAVKKGFKQIIPAKYLPYLSQLLLKMQRKIGSWLNAQLVLCLIIGVLSYIGLLILGVNYAIILALIAGLFELVPYLGPILGAIPAVFLAFTQSPIKALLVVVLYFVIQQVENHVLVPKVMQKAVGLNPIVSIISLLIGAKLGGVVGALLAIPVVTALSVLIQSFVEEKSEEEFEK